MLAHGKCARRAAIVVLATLLLLPLPRAAGGDARLVPPHEDMGIDTDGDGRFDSLRIGVNVAVSTPATYLLEVRLFDDRNQTELDYRYAYRLLAGAMTVTIDFSGIDLWRSGLDGPYLANVWLRDESYRALGFSQHVTQPYLHTDFDAPRLRLDPPHSDAGLDTDGDGLFDFLQYRVNVVVVDSGSFRIEGSIRNAWSSEVVSLTAGPHTVSLNFPGWQLRNSGDGPYSVGVRAYADFGYFLESASYTTGAYLSTQFDTTPAAFAPPHTDAGIDVDGDGLFDVLRLSINVTVQDTDRFWVDAKLYDSSGAWIWDATSRQEELSPGFQTLAVDFGAERIRRTARDGFFRADLSLRMDYGPLAVATGVHITRPYARVEFAPAPIMFTGIPSDRGVDVDGDGFYDFLAVNGSLDVRRAGFFGIGGVARTLYGARDLDSAGAGRWMNSGPTPFELLFDGGKIRRSNADGPYQVYLYLSGPEDFGLGDTSFTTQAYLSSDFEPPAITYAPPHGSVTIDEDGDGLYDVLRIHVNVTVNDQGSYGVSGNLYPVGGTGFASSVASAVLSPGTQTIDLNFAGWKVREIGTTGEYLVSLNLFAGSVFLGWDFFTTNLTASEFERGAVRFRPPHADAVVDADGDGVPDTLRVDVNVDLDVAGTYLVDAYASDSALRGVADVSAFYDLPAGMSSISLDFPGWRFSQAVDGPFLIEAYVYDLAGEELSEDEHITAPYRILDFSRKAVEFTPPHVDAGLDTDGDGGYDRLAVDLSVIVSVAGTYSLQAALRAPNSWEGFDAIFEDVFLAAGAQTIHIEFSTGSVALSGLPGPYEVTAYLAGESTTHLTAAYAPESFDQPRLRFEPPFADSAEDRDVPPDGRPDVLRVNLSVNASDPGRLLVYASLWDDEQSVLIDVQQRRVAVNAGVNVFPVSFPGTVLRASGIDGPYVVHLTATDDGRARRLFAEEEFRTASYRAEDFEPFSPAVLQGIVRDGESLAGISYPVVTAYNYVDGILVNGFSDEFGNYDVGLYEGDWLVVVDDGYPFTGESLYQSEEISLQIRAPVTTYDVALVRTAPAPSLVDLSFRAWNEVTFRDSEKQTTDNRTARQLIEWEYGDRDGLLSLEEFRLFDAGSPPKRVPSHTHELFRVDDSVYKLVPESQSFQQFDVEAPVTNATPIRSELAASFTPVVPIAPAARHEIAVRVDYDALGLDRVYRVSLPTGFELASYTATSLVDVRATGSVVILDPGRDVPIRRDPYLPPVFHHEWVTLVVTSLDTTPPTILSASVGPNPVEVGEPVTFTAQVIDDIDVQAVAVEIIGPTGVRVGNFTMTGSGDDFTTTLRVSEPGAYVFRIWAYDTAGRGTSWDGRFSAIDTSPPIISEVRAVPAIQELGAPTRISAVVTDGHTVSSVLCVVRAPSGAPEGPFPMEYHAESGGYWVGQAFSGVGTYEFDIIALDPTGNRAVATGAFEVVDTTAPIAAAGADRIVDLGTQVTLDGTASTDKGGIISYTWTFMDRGNPISLTNAVSTYAFTAVGTYVVALTVVDSSGNTGSDTAVVSVVEPAGGHGGVPPLSISVVAIAVAVALGLILVRRRRRASSTRMTKRRRVGNKGEDTDGNSEESPNARRGGPRGGAG